MAALKFLCSFASCLFSCHIPQDTAGRANNRRASSMDRDGRVLDNRGCGYNYLLTPYKRPRGTHHYRQPAAVVRGAYVGLLAPQSLRPTRAEGRTISSMPSSAVAFIVPSVAFCVTVSPNGAPRLPSMS